MRRCCPGDSPVAKGEDGRLNMGLACMLPRAEGMSEKNLHAEPENLNAENWTTEASRHYHYTAPPMRCFSLSVCLTIGGGDCELLEVLICNHWKVRCGISASCTSLRPSEAYDELPF